MTTKHILPFKVGQLAEAKSFKPGFRGAWFRCKIQKIGWRSQLGYSLEFFDFPDEKITWTKVYEKPTTSGPKSKEMQLMVRPSFPPIYHESQIPNIDAVKEEVVIVANVWKVGDLVDWWSDDCYWSARVTEIMGDEKIMIELLPPPLGEGLSYEAFCKDLRPSLDWSPEHGWEVPLPMESENYVQCARIINPSNQASSLPSRVGSKQMMNQASETTGFIVEDDGSLGKTCCSDSVSSSHLRDTSAQKVPTTTEKDVHLASESSKRMRTDGSILLNSSSDTLEASILDLEELVNRVKWLKSILEFGMPSSKKLRPSWKFLEELAVITPE